MQQRADSAVNDRGPERRARCTATRTAGGEPWRRRIVFVNRYFHPDLSATSQILFDLATRLVEQGVDVHVLCSRQMYEDPRADLPAEEIVGGVRVHRVATARFGRDRLVGRAGDYASFHAAVLRPLLALVRAGDVLVAKTDPPLISVVAAFVARRRRALLVNWLQDVFPEVAEHLTDRGLPRPVGRVLRGLRNRSLRAASANVVLGTRMREHVLRQRVAAGRITVIENWADGDTVRPLDAGASRLRLELGLGSRFVVGYSGNLGRAHDVDTLLGAARRLRDDAGVVFLMVGGGAGMRRIAAAACAERLSNFRFLPYQPRETLADSLAAADVHLATLLPQLEGLIVPSKFYGILASGRPTLFVGDPDGEVPRVIRATGCGVAVATGDPDALVAAIGFLRAYPGRARDMGRAARALFEGRYTRAAAFERWRELLHDVQPELFA